MGNKQLKNYHNTELAGWAQKVVQSALDLLFPPICYICSRHLQPASEMSYLCPSCVGEVRFLASPLCPRCGKGMDKAAGPADRHCHECLTKPPAFDSARSVVYYQPPVKELLHRLKYKSDSSAAMVIAELIGKGPLRQSASGGDYIIPVPLFVSRLKMRGLNQSLILAKNIFPTEKVKIATDLLVRVKNTTAQSGLSGAQRRRNLQAAFEVREPHLLAGKNIWLIDDVFTTGTTVNECAKTLKKHDVASVHVWTCARV